MLNICYKHFCACGYWSTLFFIIVFILGWNNKF